MPPLSLSPDDVQLLLPQIHTVVGMLAALHADPRMDQRALLAGLLQFLYISTTHRDVSERENAERMTEAVQRILTVLHADRIVPITSEAIN